LQSKLYYASDMSDTPEQDAAQAPVEPLYTHPASPFMRTESSLPREVVAPPGPPPMPVQSTWITYRSQIEIGLALLAYMMFLIGSVTVLRANPDASWRYIVAVVPVAPAAMVLFLFARRLSRLDELQRRIHAEALGFSLAATALITFAYGFLEGAGMPHLNWTFVLPLMAILWAAGTAIFAFRYR
jgi:hypothetical protein